MEGPLRGDTHGGSASSLGKRTSSNAGTAPQADSSEQARLSGAGWPVPVVRSLRQ